MRFMSGFVTTHVLDEHANEVVTKILCSTSETNDESAAATSCQLFRLRDVPKVAVVTCDVDVKTEDMFLWTQRVSGVLLHSTKYVSSFRIFTFVYVLFYSGQLYQFPSCFCVGMTNLNKPPSSFLLFSHYCKLGAGSIPFRAIMNKKQCETRGWSSVTE